MPEAETFWAFYVIVFSGIALFAAAMTRKMLSRLHTTRASVQVAAMLILNGGIFGLPLTAVLLPVLNCRDLVGKYGAPTFVCNFGLLQRALSLNLWMAVAIPLLLMGMIIAVFILVNRSMCGWACPVGYLSDMFTQLRRLVGLKPREPKPGTHKLLQSVKYAGLFLILLLAILVGTTSYLDTNVAAAYKVGLPGEGHKEPACLVCPAPITTCFMPDTARDLYTGNLNLPPLAAMSFLIFFAFVIGSFYIPRFFCRYFCYLGALGSMFGRSSLMSLQKDVSKCSHCGTCSRGCPMKISRVEKEKKESNVSSSECIMCLDCVGNCPEKALSLKFAGKDVYRGASSWWKKKQKGRAS